MAEIKHIQSSKARQSEVIIKELVNVLTHVVADQVDTNYMWMKWVWHRKSRGNKS